MGFKLVNNWAKIRPALRAEVANRLNMAAEEWVSEAQSNAAVDTEFMKLHIGITRPATEGSLRAEVISLAPYSLFQDIGRYGNLFWTRAYLHVREKFPQFFKGGLVSGLASFRSVGASEAGIIKQALTDYHGPLGRGGR